MRISDSYSVHAAVSLVYISSALERRSAAGKKSSVHPKEKKAVATCPNSILVSQRPPSRSRIHPEPKDWEARGRTCTLQCPGQARFNCSGGIRPQHRNWRLLRPDPRSPFPRAPRRVGPLRGAEHLHPAATCEVAPGPRGGRHAPLHSAARGGRHPRVPGPACSRGSDSRAAPGPGRAAERTPARSAPPGACGAHVQPRTPAGPPQLSSAPATSFPAPRPLPLPGPAARARRQRHSTTSSAPHAIAAPAAALVRVAPAAP